MSTTTIQAHLRNGFTQLPDEVLKLKGLSFRAKCLYCLLLSYSRQQDTCFPSHEQMAEDLGTSIDTIKRGLRELKAYGLIAWEQRGLNKPNRYTILPLSGKVQNCTPKNEQTCPITTGQECPTNHTKSKHIIESYEDSSQNPQKEEVEREQAPPVQQKKQPYELKLSYIGKPLTQAEIDTKKQAGKKASGYTPLPHIPSDHWQKLEADGRAAPISPNGTPFNNSTKQAPMFIDVILGQFTDFLGDEPANTAQNSNRAAKLYRTNAFSEEDFRAKLYEAFYQARRYPAGSIQQKRSDGRPNRMPVFFAILEEGSNVN